MNPAKHPVPRMIPLVLCTLRRASRAQGLSDDAWAGVVLDYRKDLPDAVTLSEQEDRTLIPANIMLQGLRDAGE